MTRLGDTAAALAQRGLFVFPIVGKVPMTEHGLLDATNQPDLARTMFTGATGIGVNCGKSRLLVIDLDGADAARAWAGLVAAHGCAETLEATTGREEGRHLYFASGDERALNSVGRIAGGIDTRGHGGYVIVPPSRHPGGRTYAWATRCPPAVAPEWLLARLDKGAPPALGERAELPAGELATRYGRAALAGLATDMRAAPEGHRNDRLVRVAYRAGRLAAAGELHEALAERELVDAALSVGLPHAEADKTFRSGFDAGFEVPAVRAPSARLAVR